VGGALRKFNRRRQGAFTLIELVIVVVLIAILSAVAIPKYIDFKNEAALAASKGVASALASVSAINYAANKANSATVLVTTCEGMPALLGNPLTTNFAVSGVTTANGCTVTNSDSSTPSASVVNWSVSVGSP